MKERDWIGWALYLIVTLCFLFYAIMVLVSKYYDLRTGSNPQQAPLDATTAGNVFSSKNEDTSTTWSYIKIAPGANATVTSNGSVWDGKHPILEAGSGSNVNFSSKFDRVGK